MPNNRTTKDSLLRLLRWGLRAGSPAAIAFAICCVTVALGVRVVFWLFRPDLVIFATYYPAVLLATLIGGWSAGIVAQILGGIVAWLFFDPTLAPPSGALGEQIADFGLYALSSGLIIWASEHYRWVVRKLDEEENYRRLVVDELNHRLRNKLAVVHAVLRHELREQEDALTRISGRLCALAAADELLARPDTDSVDIREILAAELSHYGEARIAAEGEPVQLPARHAATLTLIFHELATNAAKHGALKTPNGGVSILWWLESSTLNIRWSEHGGPPVTAPQRRGFGTGLFRRALDPFQGTVSTRFEPAGIHCEMCLEIPGCAGDRQGIPAPLAAPVMPEARMWAGTPPDRTEAESPASKACDKAAHARQVGRAATIFKRCTSLLRPESIMPEPNSTEIPNSASNPGDGYPPSRPGAVLIVICLALILAGLGIENRSDISALIHSPRIEKALGL